MPHKKVFIGKIGPVFSYRVHQIPNGPRVVAIIDLHDEINESKSVTNGAEDVIAHIHREIGYVPQHWVYRDTAHVWDELRVASDGEFLGYGHLGEEVRTETEAVERVVPYK